jgi:pantoate--beta-alanine ligase
MSSRNNYLSESEKETASIIYRALQEGENLIISGERDAQIIRDQITQTIIQEDSLRIDYVSVADAESLVEISGEISNDILVSTAVFIGGTRLIDNFSYALSTR